MLIETILDLRVHDMYRPAGVSFRQMSLLIDLLSAIDAFRLGGAGKAVRDFSRERWFSGRLEVCQRAG